ncbi:hypothetical protein C1645_824721 [Glomus cerebriforme]|uniref:Uncharacterized protein n=1 Tax=Glomus cerebriforme TaxID=658196 RepID=A0A397SU98_9GLOM|nr:hypothetical protein C1645_824721 [Glomus cerebriforme]
MEDAIKNPAELCKNVKRILEIIVKDKISASDEPANKKCHLKTELKVKNSEIPEFRKKLVKFKVRNVEIYELRKKVADVEVRNAELIKQMTEENNRYDARIENPEKNKMNITDRVIKLKQNYSQNDNTFNDNVSKFNSGADHICKVNKDKKMALF